MAAVVVWDYLPEDERDLFRLPPAFVAKTVIDGVTIYGSGSRLAVVLRGILVTYNIRSDFDGSGVALTIATTEGYRPDDACIEYHQACLEAGRLLPSD